MRITSEDSASRFPNEFPDELKSHWYHEERLPRSIIQMLGLDVSVIADRDDDGEEVVGESGWGRWQWRGAAY